MERKETKKERLERRKISDKKRRDLQEAHKKYVEDLELENKVLRKNLEEILKASIDIAINKLSREE
tara:strand:- start:481 stop:678 length:198 start_codon:yes stop_codon:yes gene_type:complete